MNPFLFALGKLWQNVRHDRSSLALNVLVLTLCFFTVAIVGVVVTNMGRITRSLEDRYQITVYLADGVGEERVAELVSGLEAVSGVRRVVHLGPEQFRERFLSTAGDDVEGIEDVTLDVFPSVLEVQLSPDYRESLDLGTFAARLSRIDAVESVETHEGWIGQLRGLASVLGLIAAVFGLSVLGCSVLIVANTVKLAFIKRQRVVEVMKLFGATRALIEAPVLIEGFLQGAVGSALAVALAWMLVSAVESRVGAIIGSGGALDVAFVPAAWLAAFVLVCGGVGVLGAHLASARALRV
jgi:cell division transport system permease protein